MSDGEIDIELVRMLDDMDIVDRAKEMVQKVTPSPSQCEIAPGQTVLVAIGNISGDFDARAINYVNIVDPEGWKEQYPDYKARAEQSLVLGWWFNTRQPEGELCWFGRSELVPLSDEQGVEVASWVQEQKAIKWPDWWNEHMTTFFMSMTDQAPDLLAKPAECPNCGKIILEAHVDIEYRLITHVGQLTALDGKKTFKGMGQKGVAKQVSGHLHCGHCDQHIDIELEDLDIEEIDLKGYTKMFGPHEGLDQ